MSQSMEVAKTVQSIVEKAEKSISDLEDLETVSKALLKVSRLLPDDVNSGLDQEKFSLVYKTHFIRHHYPRFLEFLLQNVSLELFERLPRGKIADYFDVFFFHGDLGDSFSVLMSSLSTLPPGIKCNKCVSLLEYFLKHNKLYSMFLFESKHCVSQSDSSALCRNQMWIDTANSVASLPDRVINKLQNQASDIFYPANYIKVVAGDMMSVLHDIHESLKKERDCSVKFLAHLVGKLCISGHADGLWSFLMPEAVALVEGDYIWCRIWEKLLTSVQQRCLENVILPVIKLAPWYGILSKILGDSILTNKKIEFLLTNKFIMVRHFQEDIILKNIIGYLASSSKRKQIFIKLFKSLLDVWGDASALKHSSYDQHLYITKAILISLSFLNGEEGPKHKEDFVTRMMTGVQCHLDSSLPKVRTLGMIVGESISKTVDPNGSTLEFEFQKDAEVIQLLDLLNPIDKPDIAHIERKLSRTTISEEPTNPLKAEATHVPSTAESDLDSDDDEFEPYDMSHDVKVTKTKTPLYVRDCMEGLISSDDPEKVEVCLLVADKLIRGNPSAVKEVAVEFTKILLHLQHHGALTSYATLRHAALTALAVVEPTQVADYLTGEFYQRNYNIRQRLDILEILAAGAQELSQVSPKAVGDKPTKAVESISSPNPTDPSKSWMDIVQQRIEKKTRRFGKGRSKPEAEPQANRFAPVAGHFFFPLLEKFDRSESTLDLLGQDHLVLNRLLYTLGVVIHAATNAPIARQMAATFVQFLWAIRYHPQPSVRQAILFALSMTILSTPSHVLFSDLQMEMVETKAWLEEVTERDTDHECQRLAVQTLTILQASLQKEFGTSPIS